MHTYGLSSGNINTDQWENSTQVENARKKTKKIIDFITPGN